MNTALYQKIMALIPTLHGWCEIAKAVTLANMVLVTKARKIVEIGTWGGRSAFPMALACHHNGQGKVWCIDPWSSEASASGQVTDDDRKWWQEANHELVYQHFMYHVNGLGLNNYVEVHRVKSHEVEPPDDIDIFHCDGNHGPDAFEDTTRFAPKVRIGGFCVLDDMNWVGGHVLRSAEWLQTHGFIHLHPLGTGAVFLRTK